MRQLPTPLPTQHRFQLVPGWEEATHIISGIGELNMASKWPKNLALELSVLYHVPPEVILTGSQKMTKIKAKVSLFPVKVAFCQKVLFYSKNVPHHYPEQKV